jgi:hypothetical protein
MTQILAMQELTTEGYADNVMAFSAASWLRCGGGTTTL